MQMGVGSVILEKDFWVCWAIKELFALPDIGKYLIFKGGTSLSKVYHVINRFSEDIDISIDRGFLGFGGDDEPEAAVSNKERQRRVGALMTACQQKIVAELLPALNGAIQTKMGDDLFWHLQLDESDPDRQTLLFHYPSSLPDRESGYIRRSVKIEMGARADHWPYEIREVSSYVAEQFPEGFKEPICHVKVLAAERTFWEKATILHAEYHRPFDKAAPERLSRHYYDFDALIQKGIAERAGPDILKRVVEHKSIFFRSGWAKYGEAVPGSLKIVPPEIRMKALRSDYIRMQEMFFGKVTEFNGIIERLTKWEDAFNGDNR